MSADQPFDLAVVGAGIVGLACALAAARRGKRVVVIDRDAQTNGASIRNFGFITVTGQARGEMWRRARRTCDVWAEVADQAGIPVLHRGLVMAVRRGESVALLEAFMKTEMAEGCRLLRKAEGRPRPSLSVDARARGGAVESARAARRIARGHSPSRRLAGDSPRRGVSLADSGAGGRAVDRRHDRGRH